MNTTLFSTAAATALLLASLPAIAPVQANAGIQRCTSSDGSLVYTDGACSAMGAEDSPLSDGLARRIVSDQRRMAATTGAESIAAQTSTIAPVLGRRSSGGCARSPQQLGIDIANAMRDEDINRLAESYQWAGMESREGQRTLDRLQAMAGNRHVAGKSYTPAAFPLTTTGDDAQANVGILSLTLADRRGVTTDVALQVQTTRNCYFVRF